MILQRRGKSCEILKGEFRDGTREERCYQQKVNREKLALSERRDYGEGKHGPFLMCRWRRSGEEGRRI